MAKLIFGSRIGKQGKIRLACTAILFDSEQKVLLTRRSDNGRWCLPGGGMDPGESIEECCLREMKEETGLSVQIKRMVGIYSNPDMLVEYPDSRVQSVAVTFEVEAVGGELGLSDETTGFAYFSLDEIKKLDLMEPHHERIADALSMKREAYIK
ncbi:MAG: NUDIX domain-containing protein [SAR324 cluster bacterium]|nr:NUDIX domain-containing protein [SAR324 cluster bacterium]